MHSSQDLNQAFQHQSLNPLFSILLRMNQAIPQNTEVYYKATVMKNSFPGIRKDSEKGSLKHNQDFMGRLGGSVS